jgi:hypothetical protein
MPNIKPLREIDPHDVVGLFAFSGAATADKGTFVDMATFFPSNYQGWGVEDVGYAPDGTWSKRYNVKARVVNAVSGSNKTLGMLLYDVRENDENGIPLRFTDKATKNARCVVESGEAVPILTKGWVSISGYNGVAGPGSGACLSAANDGTLVVVHPSLFSNTGTALAATRVGKFLSSTGADGYALLKIEL